LNARAAISRRGALVDDFVPVVQKLMPLSPTAPGLSGEDPRLSHLRCAVVLE
jgi:hypothetical protein